MNVGILLNIVEEIASLKWAEDWDNSGLMVGDLSWPVNKIGIALDATEEAIKEAKHQRCDVLIVHHPLIFRPLKRLDLASNISRVIAFALRNGIAIISLHTNWDVAPEGVNVQLSRYIGLNDIHPLIQSESGGWGLGAFGRLNDSVSPVDVAQMLKDAWGLSWIHFYGDRSAKIESVALCGGSGGDLWQVALKCGVDLFVTADMNYHQTADAVAMGMKVCLVDHGEMERVSLPALAKVIQEKTPDVEVNLLDIVGKKRGDFILSDLI